jgi:hypothetical protein
VSGVRERFRMQVFGTCFADPRIDGADAFVGGMGASGLAHGPEVRA